MQIIKFKDKSLKLKVKDDCIVGTGAGWGEKVKGEKVKSEKVKCNARWDDACTCRDDRI